MCSREISRNTFPYGIIFTGALSIAYTGRCRRCIGFISRNFHGIIFPPPLKRRRLIYTIHIHWNFVYCAAAAVVLRRCRKNELNFMTYRVAYTRERRSTSRPQPRSAWCGPMQFYKCIIDDIPRDYSFDWTIFLYFILSLSLALRFSLLLYYGSTCFIIDEGRATDIHIIYSALFQRQRESRRARNKLCI